MNLVNLVNLVQKLDQKRGLCNRLEKGMEVETNKPQTNADGAALTLAQGKAGVSEALSVKVCG